MKEYEKGDISVVWQADKCIHSGNCVRGLPEVFKPKERPWIQVDEATRQQIIDQVGRCPSGALSIKYHSEQEAGEE